jgi:chromosome segregation ATPase
MASSPPESPGSPQPPPRPLSSIARPAPRSTSRLSMSSRAGAVTAGGSRASDEDSRTAVRVAVRVRPPLAPTDPGYDLIPQRFQRSMVHTTSDTNIAIDSPQGRKLFVFDRVFSPDVTQEGVWDYLSDSISAFTRGYNVSLLAYGQSGAGKSYTMGTSGPGEQHDNEMMGVIPRAAAALFDLLDPHKPTTNKASKRQSLSHLKNPRGYGQQTSLGDKTWSLKATYVEIYNEQLRDLLVPDVTPSNERNNVAIREDVKGNIILTGLRQVEIESAEDLIKALNFGSTIRQTDATAINAKSSRSHAVFSLNLIQRKTKHQPSAAEKRYSVPLEAMSGHDVSVTTDSKLHFVDLAGSERLKNTGAQGERAKEGISINAGLASLGKVISQLSSRSSGSHVSYRDSKLTRLLQDSLGGNAITYMIACVTPAEFHLSETLNTVQYAQRARAIQSKPRIQQVEEGDKQALIDRLKAEVAFLREQISSASRGGGMSPGRDTQASGERSDRLNERQVELQNQLLDAQESYTALGQRHARLISEMARAREKESEDVRDDGHGHSADDRINRSNSFAQAVEQVVMEYEKTIQSLEHSLSSTRGTLSTTEASLLEKETKCAYIETINTQLQARLSKLADREASTEHYLRDLESKLDGHTNGEEKNAAIIMELRKEIARVRESESSCEDYISTLEERLAEADQDAETMQREIDRLEQVVERQRSLGKLDSLLHELDQVKEAKTPSQPEATSTDAANGQSRRRTSHEHHRSQSVLSRHSQMEEPIPEGDEDSETPRHAIDTVKEETEDQTELNKPNGTAQDADEPVPSSAQTRFVNDKLETVTQELFDLRVEHESTVDQYNDLHVKYEDAMRKMAELQDAVDEARHVNNTKRESVISEVSPTNARPESFLLDHKSDDSKRGPTSSLSRSLSSELSSAMESPATVDTSDVGTVSGDDTATTKPDASTEDLTEVQTEHWAAELERLKIMAAEREAAERDLAQRYEQLQSRHNETLDIVEDLKTEVHKARAIEATSPRASTPVIRRKSSQNVMIIDRAHRCFAALRNIAADNLSESPDVMQSFEISLNSAMHELHSRSERIQELEADVASAKKEMETKMTIISGLTRERSSLKSTPMDMGMVAAMRDQAERSEQQLGAMRSAHAAREEELVKELESLRMSLEDADGPRNTAQAEMVAKLQAELAQWEEKHKNALDAMQTTESEMKKTIQQLESQVTAAGGLLVASQSQGNAQNDEALQELERKHKDLVDFLREEIDGYKDIISRHSDKIAELEHAHTAARVELDEVTKAHDAAVAEASKHRGHMDKLEEQLTAYEQATKTHQDGLELLKSNHAQELAELKSREQQGYESQVEVLMSEHAEAMQRFEIELAEARDDLMKVATHVAYALGVDVNTQKLIQRIDDLVADHRELGEQQKKTAELQSQVEQMAIDKEELGKDLDEAKSTLAEVLAQNQTTDVPSTLTARASAVKSMIWDLESRGKKNSRLIEELEEQLQQNFDEAQATNNRLSTLQSERNAQLEEVLNTRTRIQSELNSVREEYAALQVRTRTYFS